LARYCEGPEDSRGHIEQISDVSERQIPTQFARRNSDKGNPESPDNLTFNTSRRSDPHNIYDAMRLKILCNRHTRKDVPARTASGEKDEWSFVGSAC
jgi:hypothetical protein